MKAWMLTIMPLFLLTLTSCKSENIPRPNELDALALRIAAELPPNWSLEKSGDQIIVSRKDPISTHGCIGLDLSWLRRAEMLREFVEEYGVTRLYKIRLRFGHRLDLAEYHRVNKTNHQIRVNKSTVIQNRDFFEDEAMRSFHPTYREQPIYYTEDSSIYVETTRHPWECIYPPLDARDCERVRLTLDTFFARYPEVEVRKNFSWMDQ